MIERLYFDHNASMPVDPRVIERFLDCEGSRPANPGSLHASGRASREMLENARADVASALGLVPDDVLFVSGGTEANNLAIAGSGDTSLPVLSSPAEHPSSFDAAEPRGRVVVGVDRHGRVELDPPKVRFGLVCLVHAQNEVGTIQDVRRAREIADANRAPLHVDACQSVGRVLLDDVLEVADTIAISPHKFGGMRGGGMLVGRGVRNLRPSMFGGNQEHGLRPGTPSPTLAAANAFAMCVALEETAQRAEKMRAARTAFERRIRAVVSAVLTPADESGLPNTSMCRFDGVDGRNLLPALDMVGVEASIGSACSSGSPTPPRVLLAMGLDEPDARCCVRFSFAHTTTLDEVEEGARRVESVVTRMRR